MRTLVFCTTALLIFLSSGCFSHTQKENASYHQKISRFELGPRPFYLVDNMDASALKRKLMSCKDKPIEKSDLSIGHRGAPLMFPEHTQESYVAAARMGAGIIECDVTFTKDRQLVCRHSQCDLHTTTNILDTPLAEKCTQPFTPADSANGTPASAQCCTSDITLKEFKSLCGKMDAFNPNAQTIEEYLDGTPRWRTDLYSTCGTLLSHKESIKLFQKLRVKFTPELKSPAVQMPYQGEYSQEDYAQQLINEYREANVNPRNVWPQSFNYDDILYWIQYERAFGRQAVYLDGRYDNPLFDSNKPESWEPNMDEIAADGVNIIAPPMWMLLDSHSEKKLVPSIYARKAKRAGLDIITWTVERSGLLASGGGWYYQTTNDITNNDGDVFNVIDALARKVGVIGIFSDWPATTTYYANCFR